MGEHRGVVSTWLRDKGFGHIESDQPSLGLVYVHVSELGSALAELIAAGMRVSFDLGVDGRGRTKAVNVARVVTTPADDFRLALGHARSRLERCRAEHERAVIMLDTGDPNATRSIHKLGADIAGAQADIADLLHILDGDT